MDRISKLKSKTSTQSKQIGNLITTIDENEKYKEAKNNTSHQTNKRSKSRFDPKSQFNLSYSRNLLNPSIPKLPDNILCQTVDLTKPNNTFTSQHSIVTDTSLQIKDTQKKNSRYRLSTNQTSSAKVSHSL